MVIVFEIEFRTFAVPAAYGAALLDVLRNVVSCETKGYGKDRVYIVQETDPIEFVMVTDDRLKERPKEPTEEVIAVGTLIPPPVEPLS